MIETVVFTQWSAPHKIKHRHSTLDLTGLALWVLSFNRAKAQFSNAELVTDSFGADVLVEQLGLKFDKVHVDLDNALEPRLSHLWCYGKLKAYAMMDKPFLHIDHDVVLWKKVPERILCASLACQNPEHLVFGHWRRDFYDLNLLRNIPIKPKWVSNKIGCADDMSINMGIYGGHDLDFIHEAAVAGLAAINEPGNLQYMRNSDGTVLSVFFEQYWTACLARNKFKQFESLLSEDLAISKVQSNRLGYSHYLGERKKHEATMNQIQGYCKQYHPKEFAICEKIAGQRK